MKNRNPLFDPDVDGNTLAWIADKKRQQEDEDDTSLRPKGAENVS